MTRLILALIGMLVSVASGTLIGIRLRKIVRSYPVARSEGDELADWCGARPRTEERHVNGDAV